MPSTLKLHVLFDPAGLPQSVEGSARFVARAPASTGRSYSSAGVEFIFEKSDGSGWWCRSRCSAATRLGSQSPRRRRRATRAPSRRGERLVRRRAAFLVVALVAWVVGSALGSLDGPVTARAQSTGVVVGKAHAGYTPSLSRLGTDRDPRDRIRRPPGRERDAFARRFAASDLHQPEDQACRAGRCPARFLPADPGQGNGQDQLGDGLRRPRPVGEDDGSQLRGHDRLLGAHDVLGIHRHDQRASVASRSTCRSR